MNERFLETEVFSTARSILFFFPLSKEPSLLPLFALAIEQGRIAALPRFDEKLGAYCAARCQSVEELVAGRFGVLEPSTECPAIPLNQLDLALVPGVAFDLAGRRLGRGKGFYDRLLAEVRGHKCGVCFDLQLVEAVPEEPHDVRLDSILTPTRWHLVQARGLDMSL